MGDHIVGPTETQRLGQTLRSTGQTKVTKEKRKVGRPIAHCGDPDSPHLTPAERRRIKRRIANRESARRVRAQRQDSLNRMSHRIQDMKEENAELAKHASAVELEHAILTDQLRGLRRHLHQINVKNYEMAREIANLRSKLNVGPEQQEVVAGDDHEQYAMAAVGASSCAKDLHSAPTSCSNLSSAVIELAFKAFPDEPEASVPICDTAEGCNSFSLATSLRVQVIPSVSPLGLSLNLDDILRELS